MRRPLKERFWSRVDRSGGPDACWPWLGCRDPRGYGQLGVGGTRRDKAYRVAWELTHGPIPPGLHCLHLCDHPPCCNPAHLHLGTHQDNIREAVERGRIRRGERSGRAVLTDARVLALRSRFAAGEPIRRLAAEFGVSCATARKAALGLTWRHIPLPTPEAA